MLQKFSNWWKHEKKSSKILSVSAILLVVFSFVVGGVMGISYSSVNSMPDTLTSKMGDLSDPDLIGISLIPGINLTGPFLATDSGGKTYQMYCLEKEKEWLDGVTIKKGGQLDAGYAYLARNGYPEKNLTGDSDKDFYLTQVAVWLYQDRVAGVSDSQNGVFTATQKTAIKNSEYYTSVIQPLVDGAVNAHTNYQHIEPKFSVSTSSFSLDGTGKYLETGYISVSANVEFTSYQVALDMSGAQIINESGAVVTGKLQQNQKFKIRLPLEDIKSNDLDLKVDVTIDYNDYIAYSYVAANQENADMQKGLAGVFTVVPKQVNASTTVNLPEGNIRIEKVDSKSGAFLSGAEIEVRRVATNEVVKTITTSGEAVIVDHLLPGQYQVVETKAPNGYLLAEGSKTVYLDTDSLNQTVKLSNTSVTVRIQKIDKQTKQPVAGAVIKILDDEGREVYRFTSGNGYTTIPGLGIGDYQAVEVSAPSGYYLDTTPVKFSITEDSDDVSLNMEDTKNEVEILKTEEDGKIPIAGAVLKVVNTDTSSTVDQWTTTTSAHSLTGLPAGNYQVEEVSAPSGYTLNTNPKPFTISNTMNKKITVSFPNTKSQVTISKVNEQGQLVAGAKLAIYDQSGKKVQEFTSKTTPTVIEKLAAGTYTIKELEAPNGYQLSSEVQTFTVDENTKNLAISFKNVKNGISFAKVDADSDNYVSGAKLRLVDSADDVIEEWTSDNSLHTISGLKNGTYYFEEVEAPRGYVRNTTRQKVVVNDDTTTATYTMKNQKLSVKIAKVDSDSKQLVSGATLELLNSNYEVIKTWTTTSDYQTFDDLVEGNYYVRETKAPDGYILNNDLESFTLDEEHPTVTVSFKNKQTTVKLGKVDATTGNYVAGATLQLSRQDGGMDSITFVSDSKASVFRGLKSGVYILEELAAPSGYITSGSKVTFELDEEGKTKNISLKSDFVSISVKDKKLSIDTDGVSGYKFQLLNENGEVIDTYTITKEVFTTDVLDNGNYVLKQVKVPDGMVLNSNPYSFTISDTMIADAVYFANDYTKVDFYKKEMIGGDQLEGAHFILRNEKGDVIQEWDSKESATRIEKLAPGNYTLSEVKAPSGYQLNNSVLSFKVEEISDVQVVTMFDTPIVEVPNTSDNALLYWFLGTIIVMTGCSIFGYVYYKRRAL